MKDILKCYISGKPIEGLDKKGIISFAVPEYGVLFRCGAAGNRADLEVIAFLTFLRFVEHNKNIFKPRQLHIFTDFPILVYLMTNGVSGHGMDAVRRQALEYAKGVHFKVQWIDVSGNRAAGSIGQIPDMPTNTKLKIKSFPGLTAESQKQDQSLTDLQSI